MAVPTPMPPAKAPEPKAAPLRFWDYSRKAGVALGGILSVALATGLLPDPWDKVAFAVIAVLTYFGVYSVTNVMPKGMVLPAGSNPPGGDTPDRRVYRQEELPLDPRAPRRPEDVV